VLCNILLNNFNVTRLAWYRSVTVKDAVKKYRSIVRRGLSDDRAPLAREFHTVDADTRARTLADLSHFTQCPDRHNVTPEHE